jgi:hypothetical protein
MDVSRKQKMLLQRSSSLLKKPEMLSKSVKMLWNGQFWNLEERREPARYIHGSIAEGKTPLAEEFEPPEEA